MQKTARAFYVLKYSNKLPNNLIGFTIKPPQETKSNDT